MTSAQFGADFPHLGSPFFLVPADLSGPVTALTPLAIPEQPKVKWFDALADTSTIATPLETLEWLCAPDSPSLGKRMHNSETGPSSPAYGPAEYNASTGSDGPITRLTVPSGSNRQDDLEDCKAKKA